MNEEMIRSLSVSLVEEVSAFERGKNDPARNYIAAIASAVKQASEINGEPDVTASAEQLSVILSDLTANHAGADKSKGEALANTLDSLLTLAIATDTPFDGIDGVEVDKLVGLWKVTTAGRETESMTARKVGRGPVADAYRKMVASVGTGEADSGNLTESE